MTKINLKGTRNDGTIVKLNPSFKNGVTTCYANVSINLVHQFRDKFGIFERENRYINIMVRNEDVEAGTFELLFAPSDMAASGFQKAPHYNGFCGVKLGRDWTAYGRQRLDETDITLIDGEYIRVKVRKPAIEEHSPLLPWEDLPQKVQSRSRDIMEEHGFNTTKNVIGHSYDAVCQAIGEHSRHAL